MWNPVEANLTEHENKITKVDKKHNKKEDMVDDCSCSSSSADTAIDSSFAQQQQQQKQQKHHQQEQNKSVTKLIDFGGKATTDIETVDSGFISGPQSEAIYASEEEEVEEENVSKAEKSDSISTKIANSNCNSDTIPKSTEQDQKHFNESLNIALDSGCIKDVQDEDEDDAVETSTENIEEDASKHVADDTSKMNLTNGKENGAPEQAWEKFYQQNDDGDTFLHLACIAGCVDVVAALIRIAPHPCLLNILNDEAQAPLHLATLTAQPNILRMLLLAGAEPTTQDRHGNTALHLACIAGDKQCVRALTESFGASEIHEAHRQFGYRTNDASVSQLNYALLPSDLEIRNYDGKRCVHIAAEGNHIDILRILYTHGADINAGEGKSGLTPLHIAIESRSEDVANFLLDECEKINLEKETFAGLTPYQMAHINNYIQMQDILEKRGAEPLTPPDSDYDSSDSDDYDDVKLYDRFGDPKYFVNHIDGANPMAVA